MVWTDIAVRVGRVDAAAETVEVSWLDAPSKLTRGEGIAADTACEVSALDP